MSEFFYDHYLYPVIGNILLKGLTQGSIYETPLVDTIQDLYTDAFDTIIGAGIGVWLFRRSNKGGENYIINELRRLVQKKS